jgi:hypothetical protein
VVARGSYEAGASGASPTGLLSGNLTSQTTRGFTGRRELADVGLVHLNERSTNR